MGGTYGELQAEIGRGRCYIGLGMLDSAAMCCRATAERASALGQVQTAGDALNNLAEIEYHRGRLGHAIEGYRAALECFRRPGVSAAGGVALVNLALALGNSGQVSEARAYLDSLIQQTSREGLKALLSHAMLARAQVFESVDDVLAAARCYCSAHELRDQLSLEDRLACQVGLAGCLNAVDSTAAAVQVLDGV